MAGNLGEISSSKPPRGIDAWVWPFVLPAKFLPRRWREMPPLFQLPVIAGGVWSLAFALFRISRFPIPAGMMISPSPYQPNATLLVAAWVVCMLGLAQAVGTLLRARWGLPMAYAWFLSVVASCWIAFALLHSRETIIGELLAVVLNTLFFAAMRQYYHNRRDWFGYPVSPR
jgi:hypothetical protein